MLRSVMIRSGTVLYNCDTALTPFSAMATSYPADISNIPRIFRTLGSSSTTRICGFEPFGMVPPDGDIERKTPADHSLIPDFVRSVQKRTLPCNMPCETLQSYLQRQPMALPCSGICTCAVWRQTSGLGEDRVMSAVREISIEVENYERSITPVRSDISRFSRGTIDLSRCTPALLTGQSGSREAL